MTRRTTRPLCPIRPPTKHHRFALVVCALSVATALAAPPSIAQAPASPAASATAPAIDPALLATASRQAYLHELERVRGTLSGDRVLLTRARRVGGRLVQRANVLVPASRGWSWAINVDTLGEPMAWVLPDGEMLVSK